MRTLIRTPTQLRLGRATIRRVPASLLMLGVVLTVTAMLVAVTIVLMLAWAILHPPRMTDGKAAWVLKRVTPGDLEMPFEDVTFTVRDERTGRPLRLAAWWIPHPRGGDINRTVVIIHGYADAKVGAIAWAPTWRSLGFHVLAIDLRAHGQSEGSLCTGGYFERHDVAQVVTELRAQRPADTAGGVVLFGVSVGATVAANAAAVLAATHDDESPLPSALVLDSPVADFGSAVAAQVERLGFAGPRLARVAARVAERASGAEFRAIRTADALRKVRCPVLMILGDDDDDFLSPAERAELQTALGSRGEHRNVLRGVAGAGHLTSLHHDPAGYRSQLGDFVSSAGPARHAQQPVASRW